MSILILICRLQKYIFSFWDTWAIRAYGSDELDASRLRARWHQRHSSAKKRANLSHWARRHSAVISFRSTFRRVVSVECAYRSHCRPSLYRRAGLYGDILVADGADGGSPVKSECTVEGNERWIEHGYRRVDAAIGRVIRAFLIQENSWNYLDRSLST